MDRTRSVGFLEASISSASFGLIPLFTLPVLSAGMTMPSLLVYRYMVACAVMLLFLAIQRTRLHIRYGEALRIAWLALLYDGSAVFLFSGYAYLPSGVATALVFTYTIWTSLTETLLFHERASWATIAAIIFAVTGVGMLSGLFSYLQGGAAHSLSLYNILMGLALEIISALSYAFYMVSMHHMKVREIPSLKLTFWVFFFGMFILALWCYFTEGRFHPIITQDASALSTAGMYVNIFLLGLLPTAISNISLTMGIKHIGSTLCSILGAFEPLTAMTIGILVFKEPFTLPIAVGFLLIVSSVVLLILKGTPKQTTEDDTEQARGTTA